MAFEAIQRYDLSDDLRSRHHTATSGRIFNKSLNMRVPFLDAVENNLLNPRLKVRSRNAILTVAVNGIFSGFAISGALYGGLHLAAWNASFSSRLEGLFWRIAALSVTCTGVFLAVLALIGKTKSCTRTLSDLSKVMTRKPLDYSSRRARIQAYISATAIGLVGCIIVPCLPLLWLLYLASRGYLVVESFKNIAYLPAASFDTPTWPSYFPHIT